MWNLWPLLEALFNLWGVFSTAKYDAIVVGAGAGGCPLAQTLAEAGLKVLLVERGGERVEATKTAESFDDAVRSRCLHSFLSEQNVVIATGNCMGGGSSVGGGVYIEPDPDWIIQQVKAEGVQDFFGAGDIRSAYEWIRERVAPEPIRETPGSGADKLIQELTTIMEERGDFNVVNMDAGQASEQLDGVWRSYTQFNQETGQRRSADTMLDRESENLAVRTNVEVRKVLFDGDWGIPYFVEQGDSVVPRARCVNYHTLETVCIKKNGRIYLTASAIHTPIILQRSGVGEGGRKFDNEQVGKNLWDRATASVSAYYQPGVNTEADLENANILALQTVENTESGEPLTILYESLSTGSPTIWNFAAYERLYFPVSLRDSLYAKPVLTLGDLCVDDVDGSTVIPFFNIPFLCDDFRAASDAGCDRNFFGWTLFNGDPQTSGRVYRSFLGKTVVDMEYLQTPQELEALGYSLRTSYELLSTLSGPATPQSPCVDDSEVCLKQSCPDLLWQSRRGIKDIIGLVDRGAADQIELGRASVVSPTILEELVKDSSLTNQEIGQRLRQEISSSYHFAGTASIGKVVDGRFKVMGVEGLYVADASALPKTTRVNIMGAVLMIGRLAGVSAIRELPWE